MRRYIGDIMVAELTAVCTCRLVYTGKQCQAMATGWVGGISAGVSIFVFLGLGFFIKRRFVEPKG